MIRGIGVDTVDIESFGARLDRVPKLRERLFTAAERELPIRSLAARFAAKEALIKALGGSGELRWHDMAVVRGHERAPRFETTPRFEAALRAHGADRAHLSMTHDGGMATAFVVVERSGRMSGARSSLETDDHQNGAEQ